MVLYLNKIKSLYFLIKKLLIYIYRLNNNYFLNLKILLLLHKLILLLVLNSAKIMP